MIVTAVAGAVAYSVVCWWSLLRFLGGCLTSQTQCYTLEVSFFSYTTSQTHAPYTEEACILQSSMIVGFITMQCDNWSIASFAGSTEQSPLLHVLGPLKCTLITDRGVGRIYSYGVGTAVLDLIYIGGS